MQEITLFDCNCCFGHTPSPPFRYARNAAELIEEMDFCGIDRALVYHASQRFDLPAAHNSQLSKQVSSYRRLEPVWTIMPPQTAEQPATDAFLDSMKTGGIRALRAFPDEHRYVLDGRTFGELFEALIQAHIPLLVKSNAIALGQLMAQFSQLTVLAVSQGPHSLERYLRPLLGAFENLYLDTSSYIVDGLIEEFCQRYGPERLLFGSGFPDNCSGAALLRLMQADIDAKAKALIAGGNLERLLEGVTL
jgi:hypothetical protein